MVTGLSTPINGPKNDIPTAGIESNDDKYDSAAFQIKLTDKIKDVLHEYNIVDKDKIISSIKIANYLSTIKSTILTYTLINGNI